MKGIFMVNKDYAVDSSFGIYEIPPKFCYSNIKLAPKIEKQKNSLQNRHMITKSVGYEERSIASLVKNAKNRNKDNNSIDAWNNSEFSKQVHDAKKSTNRNGLMIGKVEDTNDSSPNKILKKRIEKGVESSVGHLPSINKNKLNNTRDNQKSDQNKTTRADIQAIFVDKEQNKPRLPLDFSENNKVTPQKSKIDANLSSNIKSGEKKDLAINLKRLDTTKLSSPAKQNKRSNGKYALKVIKGSTDRTSGEESLMNLFETQPLDNSQSHRQLRSERYNIKNFDDIQKIKAREVIDFQDVHLSQINEKYEQAKALHKFRADLDFFEEQRLNSYLRFDPRVKLIRKLTGPCLSKYNETFSNNPPISRELNEFLQEQQEKHDKKKEEERQMQGCRLSYENLKNTHNNRFEK